MPSTYRGRRPMRSLALAGDVGHVDPAHAGLLTAVAGFLGAVVGACGLWLANRLMGKAAFQSAINDGFAKLTDQLQEERDGYRKALDAERLTWAGERATLKGEIRNLMQAIESLKAELRRHGVPIPEGQRPAPEVGALIIESNAAGAE